MTVEYWPRDEFDCTEESRRICDVRTVHLHRSTDEEAAYSFLVEKEIIWRRSFGMPDTLLGLPWGCRTICVTGPGGLVKGVRP